MKRKILLFDFDGVIVDTLMICFDVSKHFNPSLTLDTYQQWFEGSIFDRPKRKEWKESDTDIFFEMLTPKLLEISPIEGIEEVLQTFSADYTLVILSSTINSPIDEYLQKYNLTKYFDKVFGADIHESKTEKIKMIFSEYDVTPKNCLFITDTLGDMREAEKVGVQTLGVSGGYHSTETLQKGNPIAITKNPKDILLEVNKYFQDRF